LPSVPEINSSEDICEPEEMEEKPVDTDLEVSTLLNNGKWHCYCMMMSLNIII
jgi:hypothetical protein